MEEDKKNRIILMGAGKLAWHLGPALREAGYSIIQVLSRTADSARSLADSLATGWTTDPGQLDPAADILLYCVSDRVIPDLFCQIELSNRIMIHTAGSVPADVFKGICRDYGVLYPVMTFSKDRKLDFKKIPICIEASSKESLAVIEQMAGRLSDSVQHMDSDTRKVLHIASIIASNFSNYMYYLSGNVLSTKDIDLELLKPLILETTLKIFEMDPLSAQTGPASRNDSEVIKDHIDLLKDRPELQKIYTFVSDSITNHFKSL
ncbi:Rossmann-like and DUF2520 domain-containing protein [Bacteroidota bacterium]